MVQLLLLLQAFQLQKVQQLQPVQQLRQLALFPAAHAINTRTAGSYLGVAHHTCEVCQFCARQSHEAMLDCHGCLSHNMKAVPQEEVVDCVDAASERVLNGQDRTLHHPLRESLQHTPNAIIPANIMTHVNDVV
jgi:hypothetical protein